MRYHKSLVGLVAAGIALLAAACGAAPGGEWAGAIVDSAGIAVVQNPERGIWAEGTGWTVEEELRIGTAEGDPDYQFGQITGVAATSDGRILVHDQQGQHIKFFSPDGRFERTVGRAGTGPGELSPGAMPLLVASGDTIVLPDMQLQRVNRYAPDGTFLGSFRMSVEDGIPLRWETTPAGAIMVQLRPLALPDRPAPDSMDAIVAMDAEGAALCSETAQTSAREGCEPGRVFERTIRRVPSGRTFSFASGSPEIHLFAAEPVWAAGPEQRLLYAVNSEYRILVYGADGELERVIAKPIERTRVEQADRDAMLTAFERLWRDAGVPPPVIPQLRQNVSFAENFPAFLQFLAGPEGTIWVQRVQRPSALSSDELEAYNPMLDLGAPEWDVFDAEGRYLGVVRMPPRFQPMTFVGDRVYGIWRDDLDVQYAMRLRIRAGA